MLLRWTLELIKLSPVRRLRWRSTPDTTGCKELSSSDEAFLPLRVSLNAHRITGSRAPARAVLPTTNTCNSINPLGRINTLLALGRNHACSVAL